MKSPTVQDVQHCFTVDSVGSPLTVPTEMSELRQRIHQQPLLLGLLRLRHLCPCLRLCRGIGLGISGPKAKHLTIS